ncbi:MAG: alpha,alpha-trehalase ath1 [Geoglossum simile]|nr:MAG: alpha,alpha-trehalase ath1 [Geoglossum simile]
MDLTKPWISGETHYNIETMTLWTTRLVQSQFQARIPLANGYTGISLAAEGPLFAADKNLTNSSGPPPTEGWPMFDPRLSFATIAGFWDEQVNTTATNFPELLKNGGESVSSGIPHWSGLIFTTSNGDSYVAGVDNQTVSNFNSSLNMQDAIATWTLTWTPGDVSFNLSYQLFLSHAPGKESIAAVRLDIVPSEDCNGTVTDLLDGRSALQSSAVGKGFEANGNSSTPAANAIWTAVSPDGLKDVVAYVYAALDFTNGSVNNLGSRREGRNQPYISTEPSTIAQQVDVGLKKGKTTTLIKYVGIASSDGFPGMADVVARTSALHGKSIGWDGLLAESKAAWSSKFNKHVVEDYRDSNGSLPDYWRSLHITTVAQNFYLLQNLPSPGSGSGKDDRSIAVGGLTSDSYAGFVFWDADLFMSPGILATRPEYALSIGMYRVALFPQAQRNAVDHGLSNASAIYPWTSSRYGNCTATGPCFDYQYHLNGDIVLNLFNTYLATGNKTFLQDDVLPVMTSVSSMFAEMLELNGTTGLYELKNMTDPDEYANHIDNGAFTMGLISYVFKTTQQVLQFLGMPTVPSWSLIAEKLEIPRDNTAGITKEYETMNNSLVVKQADVILLNYPVGYESHSSEALKDLDWYAQAQSSDGPAMTFANYMISAAELSPSGCSALTYAFNSFEPYIRAPFFQFSEQQDDNPDTNGGTHPAYPFLTGSGGLSQVAPYGFLGYRPRLDGLYVAPWTVPHLSQLRIRDIVYMGATIQAVMNASHTTIMRVQTTSPFLVDANGNGTISIINGNDASSPAYPLAIGQSVTIANRLTHTIKTFPGNLVQCLAVWSDSENIPGQIPAGAVDGANSTKWQPRTPAAAALTVDLGIGQGASVQARGIELNWGQAPPRRFAVETAWWRNDDAAAGGRGAGNWTTVYATSNVTISNPPKENVDIYDIRPKEGNTTAVLFEQEVIVGRWVRLVVEGTLGVNQAVGASVAEFVLY